MDCWFVLLITIFFAVFYEWNQEEEMREAIERQETEEEEIKRKEELLKKQRQETVSQHKARIRNYTDEFSRKIDDFLLPTNSYNSICSSLFAIIDKIKKENDILVQNEESSDENLVSQLTLKADQLKNFGERVNAAVYRTMFDPSAYGKIDEFYWNEVREMNTAEADTIIDSYDLWLKNVKTEKFEEISPELILTCAWFYAAENEYSASKFQRAKKMFLDIYKKNYADLDAAELYALKQMKDNSILREHVSKTIQSNQYYLPEDLAMLASGLMWMKAYQEEHTVLQHMRDHGMKMNPTAEKHLLFLSIGRGKSLSGFDVDSRANTLYYDVSSLSWGEEEYTHLFDNLSFQDKTLTYSLAIREDKKTLRTAKAPTPFDLRSFLRKINNVFAEDYENSIKGELKYCTALSDQKKKWMYGILAEAQECSHMGILVYIESTDMNLNINFYTLFMPGNTDLIIQKRQALSLFNKKSSMDTFWENRMKDIMLTVIQKA